MESHTFLGPGPANTPQPPHISLAGSLSHRFHGETARGEAIDRRSAVGGLWSAATSPKLVLRH